MAERYMNIPSLTQCTLCQGFGHTSIKCRWDAKCQYCGGAHNTKQHVCTQCNVIGKKFAHLVPKCTNCGGAHTADKEDCQVRVSILARSAASASQARESREERI